ncbi:hypothetical protein [Roseateles sp.]|uniref:hypothetical protein n=1 Tax=Roseateles sp. TaxID=1971397 RepID=UPI0039E9E4E4
MPTLATLTGGDLPADTSARRATAAAPARRGCVQPLGKASVSIPSIGVTVSFTPQALKAVAGLAHTAVKLGTGGAELIGDAAQAASDAVGTVADSGVKAAIVGGALLGLL